MKQKTEPTTAASSSEQWLMGRYRTAAAEGKLVWAWLLTAQQRKNSMNFRCFNASFD